jgi:hypothetical protein
MERSTVQSCLAAPFLLHKSGRVAGVLAQIGIGDIFRDTALDPRLQRDAEFAGHTLELGNLVIGETRGPVAEPGTEDAVLSR